MHAIGYMIAILLGAYALLADWQSETSNIKKLIKLMK